VPVVKRPANAQTGDPAFDDGYARGDPRQELASSWVELYDTCTFYATPLYKSRAERRYSSREAEMVVFFRRLICNRRIRVQAALGALPGRCQFGIGYCLAGGWLPRAGQWPLDAIAVTHDHMWINWTTSG